MYFQELRHLELQGCRNLGRSLGWLHRIPGLRAVNLDGTLVSTAGVATMAGHPTLAEVSLRDCFLLDDLSPLSMLASRVPSSVVHVEATRPRAVPLRGFSPDARRGPSAFTLVEYSCCSVDGNSPYPTETSFLESNQGTTSTLKRLAIHSNRRATEVRCAVAPSILDGLETLHLGAGVELSGDALPATCGANVVTLQIDSRWKAGLKPFRAVQDLTLLIGIVSQRIDVSDLSSLRRLTIRGVGKVSEKPTVVVGDASLPHSLDVTFDDVAIDEELLWSVLARAESVRFINGASVRGLLDAGTRATRARELSSAGMRLLALDASGASRVSGDDEVFKAVLSLQPLQHVGTAPGQRLEKHLLELHAPSLTRLICRDTRDLNSLVEAQCSKLAHLDLSGSPGLTDYQFLSSSACRGLESLSLHGCPVDDRDMAPLMSLDRLTHLDVSMTGVTRLENISRVPSLTRVNLSDNAALGERHVIALERCNALEELSVAGCGQLDDVRWLRRLVNVSHADLSRTQVDSLSLTNLSDHPSLRRLTLAGCRVADLSPLRTLPRLQHLDVSQTHVADEQRWH